MAKNKKANWMRDPRIEKMLAELGFSYELVKDIPLTDIDWHTSRDNIARINKDLIEGTVDDFVVRMKKELAFYTPVLYLGDAATSDNAVKVINAGVHRTVATYEAGYSHMDAYVVNFPNAMEADLFAFNTNQGEGNRNGSSDAVLFALQQIEKYGMTTTEAAKKLGVKRTWVTNAMRLHRCRQELSTRRMKPELLVDGVISVIASASENENVMVAMTKAAHLSKVKTQDMRALNELVKVARTEALKLKAIDGWVTARKSSATQKRSPMTLELHTKFFRAFRVFMNMLLKITSLGQIGLKADSDEAREEKKQWQKTKKQGDALFSKVVPIKGPAQRRGGKR